MSAVASMPTSAPAPGSAAEVLAGLRDDQAAVRSAEVRLLTRAVEWAALHSADSVHPEALWLGAVPLAGAGAPSVREDAVVELAAALGMSTDAGRAYLGDALELRHRLPRLWGRVVDGQVPVWRARRVAAATHCLSREAAAWVDGQVASYAHRVGPATLEALVADALRRFQPEDTQARLDASGDRRHVTVHRDEVSYAGTVPVTAELDLPDALDLDLALSLGAAQLLECGSGDSLDARRATALGELARRDLTLTYPTDGDEPSDPAASTRTEPVRPVTLYVHLSDSAVSGATPGLSGRCEATGTAVDVDTVRAWCGAGQVTVKPVIDLADHVRVDAWEVPERLAERVRLRDGSCVFPWCTRPARPRRGCDCDHVVPHARGGPTCPCNLAPLCRRHHRMKTHAGWSYTSPEVGSYVWRSPYGQRFLRDHRGTLDLDSAPACPRTRPTSSHPPRTPPSPRPAGASAYVDEPTRRATLPMSGRWVTPSEIWHQRSEPRLARWRAASQSSGLWTPCGSVDLWPRVTTCRA
ncbi:MAG: HNH endonuclease [Nocardioides sp.]